VVLSLIAAALLLPASCSPFNLSLKPGGFLGPNQDPISPNQDPISPNPGPISLSLGSYTDPYTIAYTDETTAGPFSPGDSVPATGETIKSITTTTTEILIGRPDTDAINLNIDAGGNLDFRLADGDGYVPIGSYAEFQKINTALSGTYKQEADLDLMGLTWNPVGPFAGTFDGNGKSIHNLSVTLPNSGLFGLVADLGTVENVHIRSGLSTSGGIVGTNNGKVDACSNAAAITGYGPGGIVGLNHGTITACYNTGAVSGMDNIGGVAGVNAAIITACYNTGAVSGIGDIGGVVGRNNGTFSITACYNTGAVSGTGNIGGVVGHLDSGSAVSNYWRDGVGTATAGIGSSSSNTNATPFSDTAWPSAGTGAGQDPQWGIGDGSGDGKYWKNLGGWNGGSPVYPKLWYED
jgi:hypothetical protein